MSFAKDVKKELVNLELTDCCLKAQLSALIMLNANIILTNKGFKIEYRTTSLSITRLLVSSFKRLYQVNAEILVKKREKLDYRNVYYVILKDNAAEILKDLSIINEDNQLGLEIDRKIVDCENCINAFLRGAFLAKGSINDPHVSNYHLEIVTNNKVESDFILELLSKYYLNAKVIERAKGLVVYLKKSEHVGDFLRIIGATNSLFVFEDARIKRDLNNSINRIINCDLANSTRTLESAKKQLESIKIIEEQLGYEKLSTRLMEAVILRTTYPESSLSELSEASFDLVGRNISKSGLNHCFRSINELAEQIKKNKR